MPYSPIASDEAGGAGGTCVLRGCVPKKLFVYCAEYREAFKDAQGFGWALPGGGAPTLDWPAFLAKKNAELKRLNGVYLSLLKNSNVDVSGRAGGGERGGGGEQWGAGSGGGRGAAEETAQRRREGRLNCAGERGLHAGCVWANRCVLHLGEFERLRGPRVCLPPSLPACRSCTRGGGGWWARTPWRWRGSATR